MSHPTLPCLPLAEEGGRRRRRRRRARAEGSAGAAGTRGDPCLLPPLPPAQVDASCPSAFLLSCLPAFLPSPSAILGKGGPRSTEPGCAWPSLAPDFGRFWESGPVRRADRGPPRHFLDSFPFLPSFLPSFPCPRRAAPRKGEFLAKCRVSSRPSPPPAPGGQASLNRNSPEKETEGSAETVAARPPASAARKTGQVRRSELRLPALPGEPAVPGRRRPREAEAEKGWAEFPPGRAALPFGALRQDELLEPGGGWRPSKEPPPLSERTASRAAEGVLACLLTPHPALRAPMALAALSDFGQQPLDSKGGWLRSLDSPMKLRKMLAKGVKRKRSEDEANPPTATPSSSLFSLSVSKLHQSLQRIEPNLRHLVLVANMLRRLQGEMQLPPDPVSPAALGEVQPPSVEASSVARHGVPTSSPSDTCKSSLPAPSPPPPADELLFPSMDISIFSTLLEDLSGTEGLGDPLHPSLGQPEGPLSPEPTRTSHPAPPSPLEILGPGGYVLEDGLEDIFEDIDTSMYDSELWSPAGLPNLKEGFSSSAQEWPDLADLDYLMDILVEAQEL